MGNLKRPEQPFVEKFMWREASYVLTVKEYFARCRRVNACYDIEKCGFSSAVRSDQASD